LLLPKYSNETASQGAYRLKSTPGLNATLRNRLRNRLRKRLRPALR